MKTNAKALIYLWISILIFAAANSVIAKLGMLGATHLVDGRNPISFCNVLFTANIIAGLTLLGIHRKAWTKKQLSKITKDQWMNMLLLAVMSGVVGPSLFFIGLMLTEVINVVLISTIDIPLTLLLAWILMKERPSLGTVLAGLVTILGIGTVFFLHQTDIMPMEMRMTMVNIGEGPLAYFLATTAISGKVCISLAVFFTVFSVEYSRKVLSDVPIGIFSVFRILVGAVIFFAIVLIMLGWVHFIDIFNPYLWQWMLFYGGVIVSLGLYLWYKGMRATTAADLSTANSFQPIAGIFFAYLILGEIPEFGQVIGGCVILIGIAIALFTKLHKGSAFRGC